MIPIVSLLGVGKTLIDRLVPDKNARAQAIEALDRMQASGELGLLAGQLEINRVEAAHKSIFVAGWRPAVGWVCGLAMANNYILVPYLGALFPAIQPLDLTVMMPVLMVLLGARTVEKVKHVAREK